MKKIVFPFLGILMLGSSGCLDKGGDHAESYSNIPAVVQYDYTTRQPSLITSMGKVIVPELQKVLYSELDEDDAVLADFKIYDNLQTSTEYTIASDVKWIKISQVKPYSSSGGKSVSGNFNFKIEEMNVIDMIFYDSYKTVMFMVFTHIAPGDQRFDYEMTYDPDENSDIVYIRAKERGQGKDQDTYVNYIYAFDMRDYLMTLKGSGSDKIEFNLQYKIGEEDGNDVFGEWSRNPVEIEYK